MSFINSLIDITVSILGVLDISCISAYLNSKFIRLSVIYSTYIPKKSTKII